VAPAHRGGLGFSNLVPPHNTPTAGTGEVLAAAIAVRLARGEDSDRRARRPAPRARTSSCAISGGVPSASPAPRPSASPAASARAFASPAIPHRLRAARLGRARPRRLSAGPETRARSTRACRRRGCARG
jgi:hypothetical protein